MTRKQRTKIRRNNYRAWKQAQEQRQASAATSSETPAAPAPSPSEASLAAAPQVAQPKTAAPANPNAPFPGALIPFNPKAPVDVAMLHQRLRFGGPEVTDEERLAIAHRLEQYAALEAEDEVPPEEIEEFRRNMRSVLRDSLRRFCIPWPPPGETLRFPRE